MVCGARDREGVGGVSIPLMQVHRVATAVQLVW